MTRFYGQSPKGLNANGDGEMQNYLIKITSMQENILTKIYDKIDIIIKNTLDINYIYDFPPLWIQSDKDKAQAKLWNAQADQIYMTTGTLSAEEIKTTLVDNETYPNLGIDIDETATPDLTTLNSLSDEE